MGPPLARLRRLVDGARSGQADDGAPRGFENQVRLEPVRGRHVPGKRQRGLRARSLAARMRLNHKDTEAQRNTQSECKRHHERSDWWGLRATHFCGSYALA